MSPRVWLITGSSSGFGRTLTEYVLKSGDIAIATLRRPEVLADLQAQYPAERLLVLKLDVTKPQEISAAFQKAKDAFGRIDVVYNNAGYGVIAEVEGTTEDVARAMFETNFWGAANVSREAVKFFREVNKPVGGRLLTVSSIVGIKAMAVIGYYGASKYALECLTETLAMELDPDWNIKISLIEPGGYETNGKDNSVRCPPHPAYTKASLPTVATRDRLANLKLPGDVNKAIVKIYELAGLDNPPLRLPLGKDVVNSVKAQIASLTETVDKYESWSENLTLDNAHLDWDQSMRDKAH